MAGTLAVEKIILFDGVCNLCSAAVQFVINRDAKVKFHFASLQSEFAKKFLADHRVGDDLKTIVLAKGDKCYLRSDAVLEICRELSGLWPCLYLFKIIPRFIRDGVYDFISRRRYSWFGKTEVCWLPSSEMNARFVD